MAIWQFGVYLHVLRTRQLESLQRPARTRVNGFHSAQQTRALAKAKAKKAVGMMVTWQQTPDISTVEQNTKKNMEKNTCLLRWVCPAHFVPCGLRQCGGQDWGMLPGYHERGHSSSEAEQSSGQRLLGQDLESLCALEGVWGGEAMLVAEFVRPLDCKPYVTMLPYVAPDHASDWGLRWLGGGWVWFDLIRYDSASMSCHAIFTHSLSTRTGRNWCTTSTRRSRRVMAPSWSFSQDGVLTAF